MEGIWEEEQDRERRGYSGRGERRIKREERSQGSKALQCVKRQLKNLEKPGNETRKYSGQNGHAQPTVQEGVESNLLNCRIPVDT